MLRKQQLFIGIDGGGTKCRARLESASGHLLGEALAGPANPATDAEQAIASVLDASRQALAGAGFTESALASCQVVLGLAGVNVPSALAHMEQWSHPFGGMKVTTDLHIACAGAHGGQDGGILITGTGTSAFSTVAGQQHLFSAQGFPLGDRASGAWLGWQAVGATLDVLDGLQPHSGLTQALCRTLAVQSNMDLIACCLPYKAADFAALAPLVLQWQQQEDQAAQRIVQQGLDYVQALLQRLQQTGASRLAMLGGLAPAWRQLLPESLQQQLSPVQSSAEAGAVALARQFFMERSE
ncbi:BadF/BadG/BcrA/BcrD ATPase family protein [Rheinheimera marina]|uniref:BadF/BadG/BcrA/BcrD ATPase family protein n=1 Tax=Rheinheimera marina TaxID=1774958 RepID=A0ABV9JLL2_9GAMM